MCFLTVQQLAAAQLTYSNGQVDAKISGLLGQGALTPKMQSGGSKTFNVIASTTLDSLRQYISISGLAITASLVNDGSRVRLAL